MKDYSHSGKVKEKDLVSCYQSLSLLLRMNNTAWDFLLTALLFKILPRSLENQFERKFQFKLGYNLLVNLANF